MKTAITIVKLRWALTWANMRKSVWQTIGYIFGWLMGAGLIALVAATAKGINAELAGQESARHAQTMSLLVVLAGSIITVMVVIIQLLYIGQGSTLNTKRFELFGIPDRQLQLGILLAGLSGTPAIAGLVSLLCWSMAYLWLGPSAFTFALVAAPLCIVTMMSIAKLCISLASTMLTSRRGKNVFYILIMLIFIAMLEAPALIGGAQSGPDGDLHFDANLFSAPSRILAWTPLGAAFQLPFDACAGNWLALVGRLLMLGLTCLLCFMGCTWCLRYERLHAGGSQRTAAIKGIGSFSWMPDSVSGAISARVFTYLRRDPRQGMFLVMPLLFVLIFGFQGHSMGSSAMVWQSLIWGGWFMSMIESNGLAYDGLGFTMQVIMGVSGRQDRRGRVRVYMLTSTAYLLIMALALFIFTGSWRTGAGLEVSLTVLGVAFAFAFSSLGLAEVTSTTLMYPVPSMDKPFSSPQGRAMAQGFIPFVYMLGSLVLVIPTGIAAALVFGLLGGSSLWIIGVVGLINGLGMLALGTRLGGRLLDSRMLSIVATLGSFAGLQK
ncbi:ABC transporter permease [Bifidobacterium aemilianum]|uniref:ABC transporter permease n=1 Tax=Bifidobacterium aemilianum TaxID=2493120 RepID=A0A366K805_9BIFI|nr:ABC transporter permease [Bifidobacterium aemilianum]RBP97382.1 ABC transporter permease [Bifidobacterium aemilianum]